MSGFSGKRPASREDFIQMLKNAMQKEVEERKTVGEMRKKPTIAGTAKALGVHRDTLYEWFKEFNVKFDEISATVKPSPPSTQVPESAEKPVYLIGEALVGEGDEVAHIDLLIGDKNGPVGEAFASGMSNLSMGHTPLLAVIRPNLPPKPHTLLVPKVSVKNFEEVGKIFGPAQAAVAKAVADATEEGIIPRDKIDDWVIISSVFIHPNAKDYRRIYHYNYSATKLALKRALSKYPTLEKVIYDKDRAKHPIMGFRVPRLWRPPYLQIALDIPSLERTKTIIENLPESDRLILEVGTPLLKKYGTKVIRDLREVAKDYFLIADLKTLDVGKVEVDLAFEETADAVVASGLAAPETINEFLHESQRLGIYGIVDMMNVDNPIAKLKSLKNFPDVVILHRGIDMEKAGRLHAWGMIKEIKQAFPDKKFLVAVAGGITPFNMQEALSQGADIIIVGRYITQSRDVKRATRDFLESTPEMREDIDLFRVHVE
ncbi:MAG: bifunctional 5,6,7,8-tetrahydromethanopterin hydro-lyase/3-hexulose-6-phosphate synthase [Candidatus Bathyarchaeia archaeon]|jgi:bifunctional enzyme Fae/Hps|nr:bifunctional 5,6,7,8-tetrahydromethanopterin hydro-lyase/3-hexulose-6-phosphate synthase [Candidatus Bathyarchaeota archaeon]